MFLIPVLATFARTGQVPNFPTLIVCGFVYLAAIISFFSGLLLTSIAQKNRQDFEMLLIRCQEQFQEKEQAMRKKAEGQNS